MIYSVLGLVYRELDSAVKKYQSVNEIIPKKENLFLVELDLNNIKRKTADVILFRLVGQEKEVSLKSEKVNEVQIL